MRRRWIFLAPLVLLAFALFVGLGGAVVRQLWNWLLPPLFGWHTLSFWQALGLLMLCRILFGGLGIHNATRSRMRERMSGHWGGKSNEERERFRQAMRDRFGFGPAAPESKET